MRYVMSMVLLLLIIAGCASAPVYREIQKDNDNYNARLFNGSPAQVQKALAQMLLSKKFQIDKQDDVTQTLVASRYFKRPHQNIVVVVQSRVFSQDVGHQMVYLNALQTTERNYITDRTRFLLWVIPLPGGGGKEVSKTKESQEAIADRSFYTDLFNTLGNYLKSS